MWKDLKNKRLDENGLTTLEWLLIVAAVAGLAALAVVLVQNVVDDTAEQISGSSARKTAAQVAADAIMNEADRDASAQPPTAKTYGAWARYYTGKCNRLKITYSNVPDLNVAANFTFGDLSADASVSASNISKLTNVTDTTSAPENGKAVAQCSIP